MIRKTPAPGLDPGVETGFPKRSCADKSMIRKMLAPDFIRGGNRFSERIVLHQGCDGAVHPHLGASSPGTRRRYWSRGSRINDFFWVSAGGASGLAVAGAVAGVSDASAAEADGGGGTAALGGGSSGPLRPHADRPSAVATSTASANLTLKRLRAKRRSTPAPATRNHSRSNRSGEILAITPCQRVYLFSPESGTKAASASVWPARARSWARCRHRLHGSSPTFRPRARRRPRR